MATTAAKSRFCLRERSLRGPGLPVFVLRDMRLNGTPTGDEGRRALRLGGGYRLSGVFRYSHYKAGKDAWQVQR